MYLLTVMVPHGVHVLVVMVPHGAHVLVLMAPVVVQTRIVMVQHGPRVLVVMVRVVDHTLPVTVPAVQNHGAVVLWLVFEMVAVGKVVVHNVHSGIVPGSP